MSRGRRVGVAALALGALLSHGTEAASYCRTAACEDRVGTRCEPAELGDCGLPLYWETSCVGFALHEGGSARLRFDDVERITEDAFRAWSEVDCGGGPPSVEGVYLGAIACAEQSYETEGPNANLIVFRDTRWPYASKTALALTTVTYSLSTGAIRDADIELNGENHFFTVSDDGVNADLASVLTHEVGHLLGLAHTSVAGATMVRDYKPGSTELRTLEDDDRAAICAAYPPNRAARCAPEPAGGLVGECGSLAGSSSGCLFCAAALRDPAPASGRGGLATSLGVGALLAALRLRRRRRS